MQHDRPARTSFSARRARPNLCRVGAALSCGLSLLASAGCHSKSDTGITELPPATRGVGTSQAPSASDTLERQSPRMQPLQQSPDTHNLPALAEAPGLLPQDEPAAAPPEARDFSAELTRMIGNPASCLVPRPDNGSLLPIQIAIATQLMPSGAVAYTRVDAPTLSRAELSCITQRVETLHFAQPITNAPLGVRASLALQPSAATKPAPSPQLAAAAEPEQDALQNTQNPRTLLEPSPEAQLVPGAPPVVVPTEPTQPTDDSAY